MENKTVPISRVEAFLMPLFDASLSNINEFTFSEIGSNNGSFAQSWDSCVISSDAKDFELKWSGSFTLDVYDALRFSINYPEHVLLTCNAVVSGKNVLLFEDVKGENVPVEPTSNPLIKKGETAYITEFTLKFRCTGGCIGKHNVYFYWVGLLDTENEFQIEEQLPKYNISSWQELINFSGKPGINKYNLFFSERELHEMKSRINELFFIQMLEKLKISAAKWECFEPEKEIREYLPQIEHMYRYVRVRDRNRTPLEGLIEMLAIAGYLFDNQAWTIMAARMIMSVVHTPKWFEGPQGCMEGSTWHHVCFTEDHYLSAIATALGFMGDVFTDKGIELIMNAIEKAWQVVNKCCEEPGYRWFMNQGMVGNRGRIIGAYSLYKNGRDYKKYIEQSYKDHTNIVNNYLNDEGHCTEGGYYQYTFSSSIPLWLVYAHYKNEDVAKILPEKFIKSIKYVEASISSNNDLGYALPLGAGSYKEFNILILAFMATVCKWDKACNYLKNRVNSDVSNFAVVHGVDILTLLRFMPKDFPELKQEDKELIIFKKGGLLSYCFSKPYKGKLLFQCERNPLTGHFNEDRGGIILEANGKTMLLDLGTTNYSNPNCHFMRKKEYHNLAYPEGLGMKIANNFVLDTNNPNSGITEFTTAEEFYPGPILDHSKMTENGIEFGADLKPIYSNEVISARRDGIFALSKDSVTLTLADSWKFDSKRNLNVRFLSYFPWEIKGNSAFSNIGDVEMSIEFYEKSGLKFNFDVDDAMIDSNLVKVYTLMVFIEAAKDIAVSSKIVLKDS